MMATYSLHVPLDQIDEKYQDKETEYVSTEVRIPFESKIVSFIDVLVSRRIQTQSFKYSV